MTAETVAKALGGRKAGAALLARCPAHDDRAPSLAIADAKNGKVLVRCHAGSDQRDVIVLADGDDAGEKAARDCARRWMREGRHVRIAWPPNGSDFNDLLLGSVPGLGEGAR